MKKTAAMLLVIAMLAALTGCVDPAPAPAIPAGGMPKVSVPMNGRPQETEAPAEQTAAEPEKAKDAAFRSEAPCLLTSGGQSADYQMVGTIMTKLGIEYTMNNLAASKDLGNAKTLIVVVGGSSKGLGAAGIDADEELARIEELIAGAKAAGLPIIAMHTGGSARRGDLSDKFITPVFSQADYAVVVKTGDTDGMIAGVCSDNGVSLSSIAAITDVAEVLPPVFAPAEEAPAEEAAPAEAAPAAPSTEPTKAGYHAEGPVLLTSGGQSADYQMVGTIMTKLGIEYTMNNLATSKDLGSAKTLIVVVGGSSKGLGAAGIDADEELARIEELIAGAKAAGLDIIAMHTGGNARRGDLSDKFIPPVFEQANYAVIVTTGDTDGLMAGICEQAGIPNALIGGITGVADILPPVFAPAEEAAPVADAAEAAPAEAAAEAAPEAAAPKAQQPILLTSGGQSADYQMVGTIMNKLGLTYSMNNLATSKDLGSAKTLVVVVGGSSKGLGAAGIDADEELARIEELIAGARSAGLTVIAMHTGGNARRGDLSDKFIPPVFEQADFAVVVTTGDTDGMMQNICAEKNIPVDAIAGITGVADVLPALFN